jgi:hypothetical protein
MQRRQIIEQLREEGTPVSVTRFKAAVRDLGYPLSSHYEYDEAQVIAIKATITGERCDRQAAPDRVSGVDEETFERTEGNITTAIQCHAGTIKDGLRRFDASLTRFEEQAASAVVARIKDSEHRIMRLVEAQLMAAEGHGSEFGLSLDVLWDENVFPMQLGFTDTESAGLLSDAVTTAGR